MENQSKALPQWAQGLTSPLDDKLGLHIDTLTATLVRGSMPVLGNTQPFGLWHGGASAVLVESLASLGAAAYGYPDRVGVGVDLNVTHLRSVRSGRVFGEARLLREGRKLLCYQVDLTDEAGTLIGTGRLSVSLTTL